MEPDPDVVLGRNVGRWDGGAAGAVAFNVFVHFDSQPVQAASMGPLNVKILEAANKKPGKATEDGDARNEVWSNMVKEAFILLQRPDIHFDSWVFIGLQSNH